MLRLILGLCLLAIVTGYGAGGGGYDHNHNYGHYNHHHHNHGPGGGNWGGSGQNAGGVAGGVSETTVQGVGGFELESDGQDVLNVDPAVQVSDDSTPDPGGLEDRVSDDKSDTSRLTDVFSWKQLSYDFGEESGNVPNQQEGIAPGQESDFFIPYNNIPVGIERWRNKLFVTVPRRAYGIPATVAWVNLNDKNKSPRLIPYPSLAANTYYGRQNLEVNPPLVSVYRPKVDTCDRLWLIDCGNVEAPGGRQIQEPAIAIFDLKIDMMVRRFKISKGLLKNGATAGLISITVDTEDEDCENAFAYLPDIFELGLIVYSLKENRGWRMTHAYFSLDPLRGDFNLNGYQYQWRDDIFSVVLSTRIYQGKRITYALFHPMATYKEFAVSTEVLKNEKLATRSYHFNDVKILGERGNNTQSSMHGIHPGTGVVFFSQVAKNGVACWNTHKPLVPNNVQLIAQDDELLFYPADLKVDRDNNVWVLSNKMPQYFFGKLDTNQINFRVFRIPVQAAIANTVCAP